MSYFMDYMRSVEKKVDLNELEGCMNEWDHNVKQLDDIWTTDRCDTNRQSGGGDTIRYIDR